MRKSGFLRKAFLIAGIGYFFAQCFLSDSHYVGDPSKREMGIYGIYAIAAWGVVTLLANRMR